MYNNFEYSWIIIPLCIYLYCYYPNLRPYLLYFMVYTAVIGTINTLLIRTKIINGTTNNIFGKFQYYLYLIFHIILLGVLCTFNKDGYPNLISFGLMILTFGFIYITPHWPYFNTKNFFFITYIFVYLILSIVYMLLASCKLFKIGE
jgi:hypothetical protein